MLGTDLVNCGDMRSQCIAQCLVPASCAAIISLAGGNPDQMLLACITGCTGGQGGGGGAGGGTGVMCIDCVLNSCTNEVTACQQDVVCNQFLTCAIACPNGDGVCYTNCAAQNPGTATTNVVNCATNNCMLPCGL